MEAEESDSRKKIWSFDDMVKVMKPTAEELKYRKEKSKEADFVQKYSKLFKCTKCQSNLKSYILSNENVPTHPCLGVLMCQNCCNYYEDGEFSLDSDGEDKYCRWCGEGGTILGCSKCICGFCAACIKRHFGWKYFKEVQKDENWLCFFCNQKPLWEQRFICSLAIEVSESVKSGKLLDSNKKENVNGLESPNGKSDTESKKLKINTRHSRRKKRIKSTKKQNDESSEEAENSTPSSVLKNNFDENRTLSSNDDSDLEVPIKKRKISSTSLQEGSSSLESQLTNEIKTSTPSFVLKIGNKKRKIQRSADNSLQRRSNSMKLKKDKNVSGSFESIKSNTLSELRKILLLSKQQMNLGMNWTEKTLEKLKCLDIKTPEELEKECQIVKWFLSTVSTYLVEFSNSVERVEKKLLITNKSKSQQQDSPDKGHCDYTKILQILGFFSNQIKTFMEKGLSLPEVLEAEVYNDHKIIGIKKKQNSSNEEISEQSVSSCSLRNNVSDTENSGNDAENNDNSAENNDNDTENNENDTENNENDTENNENDTENNENDTENNENDTENNENDTENNDNDIEKNDNDVEKSESMIVEELQVDDSDKAKDELLDLVVDEALGKDNDFEDVDEKDEDSSSTTVGELNDFKIVDREDIRQILAILENA